MSMTLRCGQWFFIKTGIRQAANSARDNLVDNFSKHKDEVDEILAKGIKKMGLNGN